LEASPPDTIGHSEAGKSPASPARPARSARWRSHDGFPRIASPYSFKAAFTGAIQLAAPAKFSNRGGQWWIASVAASRRAQSPSEKLDRRIGGFDEEFTVHARQDAAARRLAMIPGIGVMNATALVAAIGEARGFAHSRDLAAWLGLVPRQATTGGKPRLLGIT
jgi:hypothetical protein